MIAQQRFSLMPTVVKNLLIINGLFFMGMISFRSTFGVDITQWLGLYYPASESFIPSQLVTHMFMHGNIGHIASNMIMLWFLGSAMENYWGSQRFLIYYMLTGLGASALQIAVNAYEYYSLAASVSPENLKWWSPRGPNSLNEVQLYQQRDGGFKSTTQHAYGRSIRCSIRRTACLWYDLP